MRYANSARAQWSPDAEELCARRHALDAENFPEFGSLQRVGRRQNCANYSKCCTATCMHVQLRAPPGLPGPAGRGRGRYFAETRGTEVFAKLFGVRWRAERREDDKSVVCGCRRISADLRCQCPPSRSFTKDHAATASPGFVDWVSSVGIKRGLSTAKLPPAV